MTLLTHQQSYSFYATNQTTPVVVDAGTTITPGASNTKGSYATLIAAGTITRQVEFMRLQFCNNDVSAAVRDAVCDIGIDRAGGTSFSVIIPDLLLGCAGGTDSGGLQYKFPIRIPSGSTIGARGAVNNATAGTFKLWIEVWGALAYPEDAPYNEKVVAYGVGASSNGTNITPGVSGSKGSYTSLGTTSRRHQFWQLGVGFNDATLAGQAYYMDLAWGDATNKNIIVRNRYCANATDESVWAPCSQECTQADVPSGATIYARAAASSGTSDSNVSVAAYGV